VNTNIRYITHSINPEVRILERLTLDEDVDYKRMAEIMEFSDYFPAFWRIGGDHVDVYDSNIVDLSTREKCVNFLENEVHAIEARISSRNNVLQQNLKKMKEELKKHNDTKVKVKCFVMQMEHCLKKRENYPWEKEHEIMYAFLLALDDVRARMNSYISKAERRVEELALAQTNTDFYKGIASLKVAEDSRK